MALGRARAASRVSVLRTRMGVGGRWGQWVGERGGRVEGVRRCPVGGEEGRRARRGGRRDLVAVAVRARTGLRLVVGGGGGEMDLVAGVMFGKADLRLARREGVRWAFGSLDAEVLGGRDGGDAGEGLVK